MQCGMLYFKCFSIMNVLISCTYVYDISNSNVSIENEANRAFKSVMEILRSIYIVDKYLPV